MKQKDKEECPVLEGVRFDPSLLYVLSKTIFRKTNGKIRESTS